ncbi:uncharacterized protein PRCAT00000574001 [Priceomyces carsonii]|uniref:uncharacterized protein n=1 Tax=Priceomyces carsonii TaxID=28549 RepID=UPI002ED83D50|nr:unnamed protein product [Priceomyces carsonii]
MSTATATRQNNKRYIKRPDNQALKVEIDLLKAEIKKLDLTNNEINAQISKTVSSPEVIEKRKQLQLQLKELIAKQAGVKAERNSINEQIKNVDQQLKRKITEILAQTSKNNFKNVQEIDSRVDYLDKLIETGDLKLADERRYVKEMSSLRKLRKDFGVIEKQQELIDQDKAKIAELKKKLNSVQNKELQQEFERVQKELNSVSSQNETIVNKRNSLFNKRNEIKKAKDEKYDSIRKLRSDFDAEYDNFKKAMADQRKQRAEEAKQQQVEERKQKQKEEAEKQLADASVPAFTDEINSIHNLLTYFDPTYVKPQKKTFDLNGESNNTPSNNIRKIEMPDDVVPIKKEQESFFVGSKTKKTKQKKTKAKNFTVDPEVIVALGDLSIPLPIKSEDVSGTVETLKETLKALEEKQDEQTKVNIEKAKAKIAKLEEESERAEEEHANGVVSEEEE